MNYFCLDVGGTRTRGAVFSPHGRQLAKARTSGGALSLGVPQAEKAIRDVWRDICDQLGADAPDALDTTICAGVAGKGLPGRCCLLAGKLDDFADTKFVSDGYGALLAATGGKPGGLISVGTGVTAIRLDKGGNTRALSGWGFPAGDSGSGAWLGLKLVGDLTKYLDGVRVLPTFPDNLARDAMGIVGDQASLIMNWQMAARPRDFGMLAPLIIARAGDGDLYARHLLVAAATEIADLAGTLFEHGSGLVHLAGGLGAVLLPYCANKAPDFDWEICDADPVQGLLMLAMGRAPGENLLSRPGLS